MIDYLNAEDGNVEFYADHTLVGRADNAEDLADILINNDVAEAVYGSRAWTLHRNTVSIMMRVPRISLMRLLLFGVRVFPNEKSYRT